MYLTRSLADNYRLYVESIHSTSQQVIASPLSRLAGNFSTGLVQITA